MNVPYAIAIKLASVLLLSLMSALIRAAGAKFPVGEIVFFRSAFAILPVVVIYAARGHLLAAISTARPFGHLGRGVMGIMSMFLNFAALARLPLMDATAISLCMDNGMPIVVFNMNQVGNIKRAVLGERVGSTVLPA